jgi:hypothetical protein
MKFHLHIRKYKKEFPTPAQHPSWNFLSWAKERKLEKKELMEFFLILHCM